jgi:hypothetical protein
LKRDEGSAAICLMIGNRKMNQPSAVKHRPRKVAHLLFAVALFAGCDRVPKFARPEPQLSPQAIATREMPPEREFRGILVGQPMHLVVDECEVFRVTHKQGDEVEWTNVLALEPYLWPSECVRQSMRFDAGKVIVRLGRQAFGAGGCCIRRGTYHSADGIVWEKTED